MKQKLKTLVRSTGLRREHLAAVYMCCERTALAWVKRPRSRSVGRILCYHSLGQPAFGVNDVEPRDFRRHIELALSAGYRFVPASEIVRTGGGAQRSGDHVRRRVEERGHRGGARFLAEYRVPGSVYVVSDWSEGRGDWDAEHVLGWREIEGLAKAGIEIGSHSATHPNFGELEPSRVVDELGALGG